MSCKFDKEIIQKYVDNTIEPLELIILKEHIAVCQDCKFELELMTKLENSMYGYFDSLPNYESLDQFTDNVLAECCRQNDSFSYMQVMSRAWEINKTVVHNTVRYASYLPGSKLAAKTAKKARKSINNYLKNYAKNSFKKLITGIVK